MTNDVCDEMMAVLADNIRYQLFKRNWSKRELARVSTVPVTTVCRVCRGQPTEFRSVYMLALALNVTLDSLVTNRKGGGA